MEYQALQERTKQFGDETSIHGIPHVIKAKTKPARALWAIVCLVAIGWFSYMLGSLIIKYFSYPVEVRVTEVCDINNTVWQPFCEP